MAEATSLTVQPNTTANMLRQLVVLIGLAASVAIGVAVALWSQTPSYGLLYGSLSARDVGDIMNALQSADIEYKVDQASGAILVPNSRIHEARMKLAAAGLPNSASIGYELLDKESGFGTSMSMEKARMHRALEGELARSVAQVSNVRAARVHLAMPAQSAFIRDKRPPSASVLIDLYPGRSLEDGQVAAIAHLVASSVAELDINNVTVVDQRGNLLTHGSGNEDMLLAARHLEYTRKVEADLVNRIESILGSIVGHDRVRAEVTAELDFTATESTSRQHNADLLAKVSEQHVEETQAGPGGPQGIPGALSNQPPPAGQAPETTGEEDATGTATEGVAPAREQEKNHRRQEIVNYQPDETISHTKPALGDVRRLSVAVVVDSKTTLDEGGNPVRTPLTEEELAAYTTLVKQAVGFNELRGDSLHVTSMDFTVPETPEPLPEPPFWEQPWVWDVGKQVGAAIFILVLVFGVLRPFMRQMMSKVTVTTVPALAAPGAQNSLPSGAGGGVPNSAPAGQPQPPRKLAGALSDNADLETIKAFALEDPKLAAQVVKTWVGDD
jgi:flagellar M-ring protein FliF